MVSRLHTFRWLLIVLVCSVWKGKKMVTRRSAAATGDVQCPTLKLIMEKGPVSGKTHDFLPGTCVRIGRIARGNTLVLKDAGISSKHLLIKAEMIPNHGQPKWTVTDLGSSNGTILNGEQLEQSTPALLSDEDIIKIGERTSIRVKFEVNGNEDKVGSRGVRKNTRGGRGAVADIGPIDEKPELEDKSTVNNLGARMLQNSKSEELRSEVEKMKALKGKGIGRRAQGFQAKELNNQEEVEMKIECVKKVSTRRTRNSKKEENLEGSTVAEVNDNKKSEAGQMKNASLMECSKEQPEEDLELNGEKGGQIVLTRKGRGRPRKLPEEEIGGGVKGKLNVVVDESREEVNAGIEGDKVGDLGAIAVKRGPPRMGLRSARGQKAGENMAETGNGFEGKRTRKNKGVSKPISEEIPLEDNESDKRESEMGVNELVEEVYSVRESAGGLASTSGANDIGKMVVDLDKMTMGEWLDYLDVFLPKQITDETEEMISEMRNKSERLHEFMLQQKKG